MAGVGASIYIYIYDIDNHIIVAENFFFAIILAGYNSGSKIK